MEAKTPTVAAEAPLLSHARERQVTPRTVVAQALAGPMALLLVATVAAAARAVAPPLAEAAPLVVVMALQAMEAPPLGVHQRLGEHLDALMVKTVSTTMVDTMVWKNRFGIFTITTATLTSTS